MKTPQVKTAVLLSKQMPGPDSTSKVTYFNTMPLSNFDTEKKIGQP